MAVLDGSEALEESIFLFIISISKADYSPMNSREDERKIAGFICVCVFRISSIGGGGAFL